jgi:hypothetical protein
VLLSDEIASFRDWPVVCEEQYAFSLVTTDRQFYLVANSKKEGKNWLRHLQSLISARSKVDNQSISPSPEDDVKAFQNELKKKFRD